MKIHKLLIAFVVFSWGCSNPEENKVNFISKNNEEPVSEQTVFGTKASTLTEEDKYVIKNYCNNLKTIAFESGAITGAPLNYRTYSDVPQEEIAKNPMLVNFQFLDIRDEKTDEPIRFFDLPLEEKEALYNEYLKEKLKSLEQKAEVHKELITHLSTKNEAYGKIFRHMNISQLSYERNQYKLFLNTKNKRKENLFELVDNEFASLQEIPRQTFSENSYSPSLKSETINTSNIDEIVAKHISIGARKGDILFRGKNWSFDGNFSIAGHTGIINIPLQQGAKEDTPFSIDSTPRDKSKGHSDGVQYMNLDYWKRPHSVLGVRNVIIKRIRRYKPVYRCIYQRINNIERVADKANTYIGKPYGNVFITMQQAPSKFICSSLVWYCVKKEYNVDVSNNSFLYVWPHDILSDINTYIKY